MKTVTVGMGYIFALIVLLVTPASAQPDPAKVLVGRWEGTVDMPRNPNRVLIIDSVSPRDGGWVAEGRFGMPPKGRPVTVEVSSQDGKLVVEFEAGGEMRNPWKLTLVGDDRLEGTANFVFGRKTQDRAVTLEKVKQQ